MQDCYINALVLRPPMVLGVRLRDLSSYHLAILNALESPFLAGGEYHLEDLALAVWITSRTMEEIQGVRRWWQIGERGFRSKHLKKQCEKWGRNFIKSGRVFADELDLFCTYLSEYTKQPEFWEGTNTSMARVPGFFATVAMLRSNFGCSDSEAWNMSVPKAMAYRAAFADAQGSDAIVSDQEKEAMDEAEKQIVSAATEIINGGR